MFNRWPLRVNLPILFAALVLASTIASLPPVYAPPNPIIWVEKSPIPYHTAQAGVIGGLDGRIYVFGGYASVSPSTPVTTARAYDPRTDTWANLTSLPTPTRGPGIAVDNRGLIYVIAGYSGAGDITNNQIYNATSNSWAAGTAIATAIWEPGATTGIDGRIYVMGGETGSTATNILQIYNTQTKVWSSGSPMSIARKQFQAVAAPNGLIYAMGGMTTSSVATATVEAYNITSNTWTPKASLPSPVMSFGASLGADGLIYVFGGSNAYVNNASPYYNTVYSYDPVSNTWYANTQSLPTARRELSAATSSYNGRMYVVGGANGTYLNVNEEASVANGHPTVTTITCSPSTVVANDVTSCNATVTDTNATSPTTPTGTVSFLSSGMGTFSGTCTLVAASSSSATCASSVTYRPTAVGTGNHIIGGAYSGDSTHNPSMSAGSQSFTLTVTARSSSTTVNCSPSSVLVNSGSTCTATVSDTASSGTPSTPTGTVSFTSAGSATGTFSSTSCALNSGSCSVTFTPHTGGTFTVTGNYGGDAMHSSSSATSNSVTGILRTTSIAISCNPTTTLANNSTKCTVTVTDTSPAPFSTPTGTIILSTSGTGIFSTCTLNGSGAVGTCSTNYTPTGVGTGSHLLIAHYGGDAAHSAASPDATVTITVTQRTTTTTVTCTSPVTVGNPTSCTVTVTDTSTAGNFITPTGTTSMSSTGPGVFSNCTLSGSTASATCSASFTPFGTNATTDTIGAVYPGDNNHTGSGNFQLTVNGSGGPNQPPVATISSITPNPVQLGQTITFTGSGTDSDGSIIGYKWRSSTSGILSNQASFQTSGLPAGNHTIYFSVEDNQGAWSQEVSTVLTITSTTNGVNSTQSPGLPTIDWIALACALAGVGVFVGYFIGHKRKNQVTPTPQVPTVPFKPTSAPASVPPPVPPSNQETPSTN